MWKSRNELPGLIKLDMKVDVERLKTELNSSEDQEWNACISGPLEELRQTYGRLTNAAFGNSNKGIDEDGKYWRSLKYHQRHLTDFDEAYELRKDRNSGSVWDKKFMKGDKKLDERAFRKLVDGVPEYMKEVADLFGPNRTRVGLAKLLAGCAIDPHRDYDTTFSCRYHIAIKTNSECTVGFKKNNKEYEVHIPDDGHIWFINTGLTHWVHNRGKEDRTHLILNMDSQELLNNAVWLEQYGS